MKNVNTKYTLAIITIILLLVVLALWQVSRSVSYQLLGNLIDRVDKDEKVVALTFDDGPTESGTKIILNVLEENNVKATFYLVGEFIENNFIATKSIIEKGHEVGNHSYSHQRMVLKSFSFVEEEIESTNDLIRKAGYDDEIFFRPPYGKKLFALPYYLEKKGITTVTWDVEPESHLPKDASANSIADYVVNNTNPGSIILLHPMFESRINSVAAVSQIVSRLREKGYRFVTVSELLNR